MVVVTPRETWTDGRLDEFAKRVDERFDHVEKRLDRIEVDIRALRTTIDHRFFTLAGIMVTGFLALAGQNAF